ncbi:MAG TPA: dihydrofolate reductase family protein [Chitinophagaceae bacterium]|nr:dihydrofolate reductase family protein [Chitinophagaceae bacterium]
MRKLKLQVQLSVDGFMGGPAGEMDWLLFNWDEELKNYVTALTSNMDCIVLGRKLAEGFIPYWTAVAANETDPQVAAGKLFADTPKVVFTKTLERSPWNNTTVATNDLVDEIKQLKKQTGGDIMAYGGARFVASLIKHNLVDEYHLFINPSAIGTGLAPFNECHPKRELNLVKATTFSCGIVVLHYTPKQAE